MSASSRGIRTNSASSRRLLRSKYEAIVFEALRKQLPLYNILTNVSMKEFDGCPGRLKRSSVDIYVPELKLVIEINGEHHYDVVNYGNREKAIADFERKRRTDNLKLDFLLSAGFKVLVITTAEIDEWQRAGVLDEQIVSLLQNVLEN